MAASHPPCDDPTCNVFACKASYWRRNGAPGVKLQGGKFLFHDMTNRQFAQRELDMAARQGRQLVPADENGMPR